ncbi:T9SS sorting signal type C domain-containing protein [Flavobacterium sp.]|jgi:hypothetical protein|uniref:T9SS sorting signal type C domain-containing protein n=1 Tax=Flavobacterium sp. TaxID=239 RepID=UPI0037BE8482
MIKENEKQTYSFNVVRLLLGLFMLLLVNQASAIDYYIDSVAGSDTANGTTISTPWKNLTRINGLTLRLGDKIFLKAGSVWNGQQLKFGGSGTTAFPIIVNQYGTGAKPKINGNGLVGEGVVYLYNQDNIEINNLEITNFPALLLYANSTAYTLNQIVYNGTNAYQVTVAGTTPASGGAPIHTLGTSVSGTVTFTYYCKLLNLPYPDNMFFAGITDPVSELNRRTGNPLGADRRGVMVALQNRGTANHIYLKNLDIHHVKGQLGSGSSTVNGAIPKRTAGIYFTVLNESSSSNSRFNDVLIDGCDINYVENQGIALDNEDNIYYPAGDQLALWTARRFSNIKVSNNVIHHIGKNAMIIRCTDETGLIERNVCYETGVGTTGNTMFTARAKGTVFQYNEGYFNRGMTQQVDPGNYDGSMYDPDYGSIGIIFQYSYSHDNSAGIYWGCNTRSLTTNNSGIPDPDDVGCTLRYCISQNDLGSLVFFNYPSAGNEIYNNVFYIKAGLSSKIIHESSTKNHSYNFYNNIIFDAGDATYAWSDPLKAGVQTRNFKNNVFYGIPAQTQIVDSQILTSDPLFLDPGKGTIGINALLDGYKLQPTSPALANGKIINPNGGLDFFGNLLNTISAPNRGMYEGSGYTTYYYKGSGSLAEVANWGKNTDGTGATPPDFISNYHVFTVTNTPALIIDIPLTFTNLEIQGSSVLLSADVIVNNNLTVGLLGNVTVSAGKNLTIKNAVINNATAGASAFVIESGANLIQGAATTVNANIGNITVKRNSNSLHRLDYSLWSSPVSGAQTLANFSPLTSQSPNRFYTYNPSGNQFVAATFASPFASGKGYLIRMPNTDPTTNYDAGTAPLNFLGVFAGKPNNGNFSITTVATKYNALGNPYPSVIDADLFKASNPDINTLYFWRKTNNPNQGTSPTTSYASYNIASATATGVAPAAVGEPTITPDKYIQVGQGFLFETAQTSVAFNNAMRVANNGNKFLKTKQIERSRIWLNLSNTSWPINQMALCYMDGALVGLDETDSKYINDSPVALTSNIESGEYIIQGRPKFDATDVVALNFKTNAAGDYTIAIDRTDGVFAAGQDVYLSDSKTGTETNLKTGSYTFAATAGIDNARFSLKYQKTLAIDTQSFDDNSISVYATNGTLYVNSKSVAISNIIVFDVQGRLIAEQMNVKATSAVINNLRASNQVLIVKITAEDKSVITKKVVN